MSALGEMKKKSFSCNLQQLHLFVVFNFVKDCFAIRVRVLNQDSLDFGNINCCSGSGAVSG